MNLKQTKPKTFFGLHLNLILTEMTSQDVRSKIVHFILAEFLRLIKKFDVLRGRLLGNHYDFH